MDYYRIYWIKSILKPSLLVRNGPNPLIALSTQIFRTFPMICCDNIKLERWSFALAGLAHELYIYHAAAGWYIMYRAIYRDILDDKVALRIIRKLHVFIHWQFSCSWKLAAAIDVIVSGGGWRGRLLQKWSFSCRATTHGTCIEFISLNAHIRVC